MTANFLKKSHSQRPLIVFRQTLKRVDYFVNCPVGGFSSLQVDRVHKNADCKFVCG